MPRVIHSDGGHSDELSVLTSLSDEGEDMEIDQDADDDEDVPLAYLKRKHLEESVVQTRKIVLVATEGEVTLEKAAGGIDAQGDAGKGGSDAEKTTTIEREATDLDKENNTTALTALPSATQALKPQPVTVPAPVSPRLTEDVPRSEQIRQRCDAESSAAPSKAGSVRRGPMEGRRASVLLDVSLEARVVLAVILRVRQR